MARTKTIQIPIPTVLSRMDDRCQIIYICPKCKQSLEMLGNMACECPSCASPLNWEGLPMRVSTEFREVYESILYEEEKPKKKVEKPTRAKKKVVEITKDDILLRKLQEYIQASNIK